jgi:hypothetical protein
MFAFARTKTPEKKIYVAREGERIRPVETRASKRIE